MSSDAQGLFLDLYLGITLVDLQQPFVVLVIKARSTMQKASALSAVLTPRPKKVWCLQSNNENKQF